MCASARKYRALKSVLFIILREAICFFSFSLFLCSFCCCLFPSLAFTWALRCHGHFSSSTFFRSLVLQFEKRDLFFFFGMRVVVHVREKVIPLQCGDGTQQVMWLGNAAMIHYDATFGKKFGPPVSIRKEGGVQCDLEARVCDVLDDNQHVFVTLEQDEADD